MRLFAIVPILLLITSLVLTFLCLFAGSKQGFLEDYSIISLDVSQMGNATIRTFATSNEDIKEILDAIPQPDRDELTNAVGEGFNDVARGLGLSDFYNANIMTWCGGMYEPNSFAKNAAKNVTECSAMRPGWSFNPRRIIQDELDKDGTKVDLTDLGWPKKLDEAVAVIKPVTKAAFILYVANCCIIFTSLLLAVVRIFTEGRLSGFCNFGFNFLAFLISALTSVLMTVLVVVGINAVNKHGGKFGIQAFGGGKFLVLTWLATIGLGLTCLMWCIDCCCLAGSHKRKTEIKTEKRLSNYSE